VTGREAGLEALSRSLTNQRVRFERAPFDHPGPLLPHGPASNEDSVDAEVAAPTSQLGRTVVAEVPAVGTSGRGEVFGTVR
jgi:hypothetical protein